LRERAGLRGKTLESNGEVTHIDSYIHPSP
jgi:hypothetical protein